MVNRPAPVDTMNDFTGTISVARGSLRKHRLSTTILFPLPLFKQIRDEAQTRGWSFSRMVRHLCEASIDGIE